MIERFERVEHDWWRASVPQEAIEKAKAVRASADELGLSSFPGDWRWIGRIGEAGLRSFLRGLEVDHNGHGGVDALPDVEIGDIGVSVKTARVKVMRPEFWVPSPRPQLDARPHDEIFFACYRPGRAGLDAAGRDRDVAVPRARGGGAGG